MIHRVVLGVLAGLGATSTTHATDFAAALAGCRAITVDDRRLACFDELAERTLRTDGAGDAQPGRSPLRLITLRTLTDGRQIFELEPAQQWIETEVSRQPLLLRVGDQVELRRGALGAFMLVTESGRSTRVRRLR